MVIRGHVVVGEVSSCWILRSVGGGAAGGISQRGL